MIFPAYVFVILPNLVGSLPVETPQSPATFELGTVCGRHDYTTKQIKAATITACQRLEAGTTIGSNKYPHEFRNEEGFEFEVKSPVFEFPILEKGIYKGGSPGADRVIINGDCDLAGVITHTGASGNEFVECDD